MQDNNENQTFFLVGNKSDLNEKRQVSFENATNLIKNNNDKQFGFAIETSAKINHNVKEMFENITQHLIKQKI